jgi:formylglycine-generating enzyme required for sulfatase activity
MTSVLHRRWTPQHLAVILTILTVTPILGCQPGAAPKPAKKDSAANDASAASPASAPKEEASAAEKAKEPALHSSPGDMPSVDAPVQKMPDQKQKTSDPKPSDDSPGKASPPVKPVGFTITADPKPSDASLGKGTSATDSISFTATAKDEKPAPAAAATDPTLEPAVKWLPKPADNPSAEAKDQAGMKPYSEKLEAEIKLDMLPIPGGAYKMGSPANEKDRGKDEGPQVEVKLEPFWMGKCEVTWSQYELWGVGLDKDRRKAKQVTPTNWDKAADALAIPTKPYSDMTFGMGKEGYPAVCMTQFAAKMYCKWLSAKTGHYYRLPTEAEWEYACRAGTTGAYSFGNDPEKLDKYAWNTDNSEEKYHKVGKKKPNPWGLYDMHGNVAEWCLDQYVVDRYKQLGAGLVENPLLPVTKTYPQLVRGGSWVDEAPLLRSAARRGSSKEWKSQDPQIPQSIWYFTDASFVGFRVVRPLRVPTPEEAARYEITEMEKQQFLSYRKAQAGKQ